METSINKFFNRFSLFNAIRFGLLGLLKRYASKDAIITYSQTGEERIILCLLDNLRNGFYVEVGSNDPIHFSNTFALYCRGWRGITIDANAELVLKHKKLRKRDIPICAAVSNVEEEVSFVEYDSHELSTISQETAAILEQKSSKVKNIIKIHTTTLTQILQEFLPRNEKIDLLSIDVEGHDFNVLQSIDIEKYRPKVIVIEMHDFSLNNPFNNEIYEYLTGKGYVFVGYVIWNGYFIDENYHRN